MDIYYVNQDQTKNPGQHHEVHTREHANQLKIPRVLYLGVFSNELDAVREATKYYPDADGCAICCPRAHRG